MDRVPASICIIIGVWNLYDATFWVRLRSSWQIEGNEPEARRLVLIAGPIVGAIGCSSPAMKADQLWLALCCVLFACYWAVEPGGCAGYGIGLR